MSTTMPDPFRAKDPPGSAIESPDVLWAGSVSAADEDRRVRTRERWIYGGFGVGVVLALAITAAQVASRGFNVLQELLIWNLIWAPYLGAFLGLGLSRTHRPGPWAWRRPQLRTRTLMLVVAYIAFLFGMGVWASKLSRPARHYHQKWATADSLSKTYRELGQKSEDDATLRRANVEGLRAGKIPEGLYPGQRDFLRTLEDDPKVTSEHRKLRRDLITDGEAKTMIRQEQNADLFRRLVVYYDGLAAKYDRTRWRPWLPVEPDPPVPK